VKDYSLADLSRHTGYSARRIRQYIQSGLLPRPKLAGSRTRYSREALGRLAAILAWRKDGLGSPQIKREVRALAPSKVEEWAALYDPEAPSEDADAKAEAEAGQKSSSPATMPAPTAPGPSAPPAPPSPLVVGERWVRVPLVPGLDLMMLEGSGELVARLAHEIQAKYRATGRAGP
jgi:DNA-binding transcriptional MerR regulator